MSLIPHCLCRGMHPPLEQVSQSSSSPIWSWDKPTASSHPPSQSFGHKDSWYNCPKVTPSLNHCSGKMLSTRQKKRHFVFFSFLQSKLQDLKLGINKRRGLSLCLGKLGTSSCLQWARPLVLGLGLWGAANIAPERGMGAGHARKTQAGGTLGGLYTYPFPQQGPGYSGFLQAGFRKPQGWGRCGFGQFISAIPRTPGPTSDGSVLEDPAQLPALQPPALLCSGLAPVAPPPPHLPPAPKWRW